MRREHIRPIYRMPNGVAYKVPPSRSQSRWPSSDICPAPEILEAIFYILKSGCPWECCHTTSLQQEGRLALLPLLASGGHLGEDGCRPARASCARRASSETLSPARP
jgi:hypothetical protein